MIKLYTINCPNCKALESMLDKKGVEYEKIEDKDEIVEKGREVHILSAPFLEVDGEYLKFVDAMKWVSKQ